MSKCNNKLDLAPSGIIDSVKQTSNFSIMFTHIDPFL